MEGISNISNVSKLLNVKYHLMLNSMLIAQNGYQFGVEGESISSALGKNLIQGTLTPLGQSIATLLNVFEDNHVIKSATTVPIPNKGDTATNPQKYQ